MVKYREIIFIIRKWLNKSLDISFTNLFIAVATEIQNGLFPKYQINILRVVLKQINRIAPISDFNGTLS